MLQSTSYSPSQPNEVLLKASGAKVSWQDSALLINAALTREKLSRISQLTRAFVRALQTPRQASRLTLNRSPKPIRCTLGTSEDAVAVGYSRRDLYTVQVILYYSISTIFTLQITTYAAPLAQKSTSILVQQELKVGTQAVIRWTQCRQRFTAAQRIISRRYSLFLIVAVVTVSFSFCPYPYPFKVCALGGLLTIKQRLVQSSFFQEPQIIIIFVQCRTLRCSQSLNCILAVSSPLHSESTYIIKCKSNTKLKFQ